MTIGGRSHQALSSPLRGPPQCNWPACTCTRNNHWDTICWTQTDTKITRNTTVLLRRLPTSSTKAAGFNSTDTFHHLNWKIVRFFGNMGNRSRIFVALTSAEKFASHDLVQKLEPYSLEITPARFSPPNPPLYTSTKLYALPTFSWLFVFGNGIYLCCNMLWTKTRPFKNFSRNRKNLPRFTPPLPYTSPTLFRGWQNCIRSWV